MSDTHEQLRAKGFTEEQIARYETAQRDVAEQTKRAAQAATWIDPVMLASLEDKKFFAELADEVRALVTLWVLSVQVHRNGLSYFVEDEPEWLVNDVPRAAEALGESALAARFASLLPSLKRGRARARLSAKGVDWSEHDGIAPLVTELREGRSLEDRLAERVLASRAAFAAVRTRAETIHADARETRRRASEAAQEKAQAEVRSRFEGLRQEARPWSMQTRFGANDVLLHAKLGLGRVRAVVPPNKIEVEFEDGSVRTLVHGG